VPHRAQHLEGALSSLKAEQAKIQATLQRRPGTLPAGAIKRGNGSMIWPVNGRSPRRSASARVGGVPSGHRHRRAERDPDPRRRRGKVTAHAVGRRLGRLRQLHVRVAHRDPVDLLRAPVTVCDLARGERQPGQVIGYSGCTGLCFGAHLHFEVRINGAVTNPLNYL
jgi:hypothetical protein